MKSRGAYETPAALCSSPRIAKLERLTVDRETAHCSNLSSVRYAELVYNGVWFSTQRQALDGFLQRLAGNASPALSASTSGKVRLNVTSRKSPFSLYRATSQLHHGPLQPQGRRKASSISSRFRHRSPQSQSRKRQLLSTLLQHRFVILRLTRRGSRRTSTAASWQNMSFPKLDN